MILEQKILNSLDHANDGYYCNFIPLNHPYSYLIDTRLNVFRGDGQWAIAAEILGYNPRGSRIELNIFYYGNCLINLERYNNRDTNYYDAAPIDEDSFSAATTDGLLNPEATTLLVHGAKLALSHNKDDYERAGIGLVEYEPGSISMEEVGRLLITQNQAAFRATDAELYKSIPEHLRKLLVLDHWYHKDFTVGPPKIMSDEDIFRAYELNRGIGGLHGMSVEALTATIRAQERRMGKFEREQWNTDRPSSYETWQQLAKVLQTGDTSHYKPTLAPNTHWSNWPESGSL
ncbi:hypothetical protein Q5H92_12790 [Hymenobacter sp. M29]|uniref:Uncharacterized protein n=1 Tax=Hymenobacter mellowenesis TaxID=3063995 RepID=A0ABT9ABL6_9BACT|nr:hypothetical protein [Hymenobacter sp. M29]MDO7847241.1 hypothetical protein [Hymenobacter sp. M29]